MARRKGEGPADGWREASSHHPLSPRTQASQQLGKVNWWPTHGHGKLPIALERLPHVGKDGDEGGSLFGGGHQGGMGLSPTPSSLAAVTHWLALSPRKPGVGVAGLGLTGSTKQRWAHLSLSLPPEADFLPPICVHTSGSDWKRDPQPT